MNDRVMERISKTAETLMSARQEQGLSVEEADSVRRSNKKIKRVFIPSMGNEFPNRTQEGMAEDMEVAEENMGLNGTTQISYSAVARGSHTNSQQETIEVAMEDIGDVSDDELVEEGDMDRERCPTIRLSKEEKARLRRPWKNALIVKLFGRKLSYAVLIKRIKRLRVKWNLKGDISLTDVGCAYYVVRFTSLDDYEFVLTQGSWMIGDSYLSIRKWVPNFVPDESPIRKLTAWVRIPNLSVEYFDRQFLHRIGEKIGTVIRIDKNTESMDRGQYIRLCVEVDLTKPLLSKFRLNGRVWKIQYEGLRLICFKCGHLGHKDIDCSIFKESEVVENGNKVQEGTVAKVDAQNGAHPRPEERDQYGTWMLVQRPTRKYSVKSRNGQTNQQQQQQTDTMKAGVVSRQNSDSNPVGVVQSGAQRNTLVTPNGSRFEVLNQEASEMVEDEVIERNATVAHAQENSSSPPLGEATNLGDEESHGVQYRGVNQVKNLERQVDFVQSTIELDGSRNTFPRERRTHNNWNENTVNKHHNQGYLDKDGVEDPPSEGFPGQLQLRDNIPFNSRIRKFDSRKNSSPYIRPVSLGKENLTPSSEHIATSITEAPDPLEIEKTILCSKHESPAPPNYAGTYGSPGLLDIHRLPHRGSVVGNSPPVGQQGGTFSEFVLATRAQPAGPIGNSSASDGVSEPHECPPGCVHVDSA